MSSADWCGDISGKSSYPSTRDEHTKVDGKEGTILDEIPVVREFSDVFPDDIEVYL